MADAIQYSRQTNKGLALLSKILSNKGIPNFFKAEGGSGKPDSPDEIKNLLSLLDRQHAMAVKKSFSEDATVKLNVLLDNIDNEQAFELTEIGIYLRDDSTGEEALFSYSYFEQGDYVPEGRYLRKIFEYNIDTEINASECEAVDSGGGDNGVYLTPHDLVDHDNNPNAHGGSKIIVIPEGETIPVSNRNSGVFYLQVTDTSTAQAPSNIMVSPTMGIKIVD